MEVKYLNWVKCNPAVVSHIQSSYNLFRKITLSKLFGIHHGKAWLRSNVASVLKFLLIILDFFNRLNHYFKRYICGKVVALQFAALPKSGFTMMVFVYLPVPHGKPYPHAIDFSLRQNPPSSNPFDKQTNIF